MKIEFNKVTWYSKLIALIIFIVFPFVGFYWGVQYGEALQAVQSSGITGATSRSQTSGPSEYYANPAEWQTDQNSSGGFSVAYPIDFEAQDNYSPSPTANWSLESNNTEGTQFFTLTVPSAFEPQTNFSDATLTIGSSRDASALQNCLNPGPITNPGDSTSTKTVNGIQFLVYHFTGVGAGNYYETTDYRTTHNGQCYSVEYTIHSAQIENYPASYNLRPFDDATVTAVLDRIVSTFRFM